MNIPKPLKEFSCTIGKSGTEIYILCENLDDADEVLQWLYNLNVD